MFLDWEGIDCLCAHMQQSSMASHPYEADRHLLDTFRGTNQERLSEPVECTQDPLAETVHIEKMDVIVAANRNALLSMRLQ